MPFFIQRSTFVGNQFTSTPHRKQTIIQIKVRRGGGGSDDTFQISRFNLKQTRNRFEKQNKSNPPSQVRSQSTGKNKNHSGEFSSRSTNTPTTGLSLR